MTDEEYWEERALALEREMTEASVEHRKRILRAYLRACDDIEKEIARIYRTMINGSGLTREELDSLMSVHETQEYYNRLREQLKRVKDDDERRRLLAEINAPAYEYRISRWKALQAAVEVRVSQLRLEEIRAGEAAIRQAYKESYEKAVFEMQKSVGFYFSFDKLPEKAIDAALQTPWYDTVYSERVWGNVDKLRDALNEILPAALMSGRSPRKVAEELSSVMDKGIGAAMRLIRTELNHYHNEAAFLSYKNSGVKKYKYHATLDKDTCDECGFWDMKIIPMEEKKTGYNFPPLHPNDRCTVSPVVDSAVKRELLPRMARDPKTGKKVKCPPGTTWREWKKQINLNIPIEKSGENGTIKLQDIIINKSVGAKARNYDIEDKATGEIFHFAEGTRIQNAEAFAGKGCKKALDAEVALGLSEQIGGNPKEWQHCKGNGIIDYYGEERPAEVHWFQEKTVGKHKFKVKEWLDD